MVTDLKRQSERKSERDECHHRECTRYKKDLPKRSKLIAPVPGLI